MPTYDLTLAGGQNLDGQLLTVKGITIAGGLNPGGYVLALGNIQGGLNCGGSLLMNYGIPMSGGVNLGTRFNVNYGFPMPGGLNTGGWVVPTGRRYIGGVLTSVSGLPGNKTDQFFGIPGIANLAVYIFNLDINRTYTFTGAMLGGGRFNGVHIGLLANGVYDLETVATDDAGSDIDTILDLTTDAGFEAYKRFRAVYANVALKVTVYDENDTVLHTIDSLTANEIRSVPMDVREIAFRIKFENIDGEQITIRKIHKKMDIFERKGV